MLWESSCFLWAVCLFTCVCALYVRVVWDFYTLTKLSNLPPAVWIIDFFILYSYIPTCILGLLIFSFVVSEICVLEGLSPYNIAEDSVFILCFSLCFYTQRQPGCAHSDLLLFRLSFLVRHVISSRNGRRVVWMSLYHFITSRCSCVRRFDFDHYSCLVGLFPLSLTEGSCLHVCNSVIDDLNYCCRSLHKL